MAVVFDNSSSGTAAAINVTVAHTVAGGFPFLFVGVLVDGSKTITGVTYAGVAMTTIGAAGPYGGGFSVSGWYLAAPAQGTNNIIATADSGTPNIYVRGASYRRLAQSSVLDSGTGSVGGLDSGSSASATATTNVDNDIMVTVFTCPAGNTITASTNTTARVGSGTLCMVGDFITTTAGAKSMSATISASVANRWVTGAFLFVDPFATVTDTTSGETDTIATQRNTFGTPSETSVSSDSIAGITDRWKAESPNTGSWTAEAKSL